MRKKTLEARVQRLEEKVESYMLAQQHKLSFHNGLWVPQKKDEPTSIADDKPLFLRKEPFPLMSVKDFNAEISLAREDLEQRNRETMRIIMNILPWDIPGDDLK